MEFSKQLCCSLNDALHTKHCGIMQGKVTKKYTNGEITIIWQNALCTHSGICVGGLPNVFDVRKIPWINPAGDTTERMMQQVKKCPSGALSFYLNDPEEANNSSRK